MAPLIQRFIRNMNMCGVRDPAIAIALSGGPDSTALASLVVLWWQQQQLPKSNASSISPLPHPLTNVQHHSTPLTLVVDHKLRPESSDEAAQTAEQAAALGLKTKILTIDWSKEKSGKVPGRGKAMVAAREARYRAMIDACRDAGYSDLVTAHHADDQAETFLLRLIHASGIEGLAGIPPVTNSPFFQSSTTHTTSFSTSNTNGLHPSTTTTNQHSSTTIRLIRPLLNMHKAELVRYCQEQGLWYVTDPTNEDSGYQRNMLRQRLWGGIALNTSRLQSAVDNENNTTNDNNSGVGKLALSTRHSAEGQGKAEKVDFSVPQIVKDVLLLQKLFERAARVQQRRSSALLRRAVLHKAPSVVFDIGDMVPPRAGPFFLENTQQAVERALLEQGEQKQQERQQEVAYASANYAIRAPFFKGTKPIIANSDANTHYESSTTAEYSPNSNNINNKSTIDEPKPIWYVDWPPRLESMSHQLSSIPHLIIRTRPFTTFDQGTCTAAASKILQAASGTEYPPSLSDALKLAERLAAQGTGRMHGAFTGGGCVVQPVVKSRGRYVLVCPQREQGRVKEILSQRRRHSGGGDDSYDDDAGEL